MKFIRKPKEVEAMKFTGFNAHAIVRWSQGAVLNDMDCGHLRMDTKYGWGYASPGTWVVRGSCGLYYPCSDKEFQDNYWELAK